MNFFAIFYSKLIEETLQVPLYKKKLNNYSISNKQLQESDVVLRTNQNAKINSVSTKY